MFTRIDKRKRGRPPGETPQGTVARERLYAIAVEMIGERGFDHTTLRDIAARAGVSVGLLYRYFPSKQAIVLALYEALSAQLAERTGVMPRGRWRDRFLFTLDTTLAILRPHRQALAALTPVIVSGAPDGLFSPMTTTARERVQHIYQAAVEGATDAPRGDVASALGRLLYLAHLAVILWWVLDRSPQQRATRALVQLVGGALPAAALTLRMPRASRFIMAGDRLFREALIGEPVSKGPG